MKSSCNPRSNYLTKSSFTEHIKARKLNHEQDIIHHLIRITCIDDLQE